MKVSVDIKEDNSYTSLVAHLDALNLLAADANEESDAVAEYMNIEAIIGQTYGLYPIVFEVNRWYEVVVSYELANKYTFFNICEVQSPVNREHIINDEHKAFLNMLDNMRRDVNTYHRLYTVTEGMILIYS
jgi:hypothetical protein